MHNAPTQLHDPLERARHVLNPKVRQREPIPRPSPALVPTGGGKAPGHHRPALTPGGPPVLVPPLTALMKDQTDLPARQGVDAARLDSSLDAAEVRAVSDRLREGSLKLLYVAPERFN